MESQYYLNYDEFLKNHPEVTEEMSSAMKDTLILSEDFMFNTIMMLLV